MGVGIVRVSQKKLHLIVLHFLALFVTTSPGGDETYCLQTVVYDSGWYFHVRDTVAIGVGMIAADVVFLQTIVGNASHIVLC